MSHVFISVVVIELSIRYLKTGPEDRLISFMHQHGSRVLGVSLYNIDGTQTSSPCYSESSMVRLTSLPTTFNPTTPVREYGRCSQGLWQLQGTKNIFKFSFYPRTISDWNRLPTTVTHVQTLQEFREGLSSLPPQLRRPY